MNSRRRILTGFLTAAAGLLGSRAAQAKSEDSGDVDNMRFPGDPTDHNIIYQFNRAELDYHNAVLHSVSEMLKKYGDNVTIVVAAFGPGIHILAKKPGRPIAPDVAKRVQSLADYGVKFHACGNTMKTLGWTEKDMLPLAKVVQVGVADIMELQEQGYSYMSW